MSRRWQNAIMLNCVRGKLSIHPNTAHSCCGAPSAIRFAAWGYGLHVSKRAVRRQIARNRMPTHNPSKGD